MPANRFFIPSTFIEGQTVIFSGSELQHFRKVLRGSLGSALELINGRGDLAHAKVTSMTKDEAEAHIMSIEHRPKELFELVLVIGFFKPQNLDFAIEKGTELGASEFVLFPAERSDKRSLSDAGLHRLELIAQAACKQCGRLYLPKITVKKNLKECLEQGQLLFFGDVAPEAPKLRAIALPETGKAYFVIGPEAGLSPNEIRDLRSKGAQGVSLHVNILRAETAVMAAALLCRPQCIHNK